MARHRVLVSVIRVRVLDREFNDYRREHSFATEVDGRVQVRWISYAEARALQALDRRNTKIIFQVAKQKAPQPEG